MDLGENKPPTHKPFTRKSKKSPMDKTQRSYKLFVEAINSPATRRTYEMHFDKFMIFSKIKDYDSVLKTENLQEIIEDFCRDINEKGMAFNTANAYLSAVLLFCEMNKIPLFKKVLKKLLPKDRKTEGGDVPYTTEEIERMLKSTTHLRTRLIINIFTSTGCRPAALIDPPLQLKHIQDIGNGCKSVKFYEGFEEEYYGFLTPEAAKSLDDYIEYRKSKGEILTPESYLIIHNRKEMPLTNLNTIYEMLKVVIKNAGIIRTKSKRNRYDKPLTYGFRKRFNGIMKMDNDVNSNLAEKLMAHKNGLDGTYLKPTREELFTEFEKVIPKLMIDQSQIKIAEKEKKIKEQDSEIDQIRKEIQEFFMRFKQKG